MSEFVEFIVIDFGPKVSCGPDQIADQIDNVHEAMEDIPRVADVCQTSLLEKKLKDLNQSLEGTPDSRLSPSEKWKIKEVKN